MNTSFIQCFDSFLSQLKALFIDELVGETVSQVISLPEQEKISRFNNFSNLLSDEHWSDFIKCKIRLFSHKNENTKAISEVIFGSNLSLKQILNNQPEEVKKVIWTYLHTLYYYGESIKEKPNVERVKQLQQILNINTSSNKVPKLQDMLGVNVNKETDEMMNEIIGSFESLMNAGSSNIMGSIMQLSQIISSKYAAKINSGEIELNKLMEAIQAKVPGLGKLQGMLGSLGKPTDTKPKERVIIDENFSTASIEAGMNKEEESNFNIGPMLKMFGNTDLSALMNGSLPDMSALLGGADGEMSSFMKRIEEAKSKEDVESVKKEMDEYLSTKMGIDVNKLNGQLEDLMKSNTTTNPE